MIPDENTFVVQLTVGQLIDLLKKTFPALTAEKQTPQPATEPQGDEPTFSGRLVYGVCGIERLFNVSHKTAQKWKDTWLKPATKQRGRKIVTDVSYAMKLFDENVQQGATGKKKGR